jgi:bisphosphoglycerate-dependent phosphoglycerate mutase
MNYVNIYWTRHSQSCSNLDIKYAIENSFIFHPNLSLNGINESINLGNFYKNNPIDIVFVSPMIRSIMTAMIAFDKISNIKKIYVVPFISEMFNIKYSHLLFEDDRYQNKPLSSDILKKQVNYIKKWLSEHKIINNVNLEIDFSIYEIIESNPDKYGYNPKYPDINNFYNIILPMAYRDGIMNNIKNIYVISHGNIMRHQLYMRYPKLKLLNKVENTQTFHEVIQTNNSFSFNIPFSLNYDKYNPKINNTNLLIEKKLDFIDNPCLTQNLKGKLNQIIKNKN